MVATLVKLRFAIVFRQLRRDWWRMLFVIAGGIWSLSLVPSLVVVHIRIAELSNGLRQDALVAIALVLAVGWVLVPIVATGVDDTLDPTRFAPWGVSARRLAPGLTVAAFTTVPAVFFVVVALVLGATWHGAGEGAAVTTLGVVGGALTAIGWVLSARLSTLWAARLLAMRSAKVVVAALSLVPLGAVAWLGVSVQRSGIEEVVGGEVTIALKALAWTPVGAGLAAAESLTHGDVLAAVLKIMVSALWVAVLWFALRDAIAHALVHPVARSAVKTRRSDAVLGSWRWWWPKTHGGVAMSAVYERSVRSWSADQRYVVHALSAFVFPALYAAGLFVAGHGRSVWVLGAPALAAMSVGWGRHNDIALDGSALWLDIVAGVPGRVLLGARLAAVAVWAVPSIGVLAVAASAMSSRWDLFFVVLTTSMAALSSSLAVSTISSVILPYQVPAAGDNPFGQDTGALGASLIGQALSSFGTALVVPLAVAPAIAAVVFAGWWIPVAVLAGVVVTMGAPAVSLWLTHTLWQERTGRLLSKVS